MVKASAKKEEIAELSFEEALAQLEQIVRQLESGQADLESSITEYERGMALKTHCQKKLDVAKLKVEKIIASPQGIASEPLDAE